MVYNFIEIFFYFLIFLFAGAVIGSFSSAILHRILNGQSWIYSKDGKAARSACPKCNHVLKARDLIPVFSWLYQRGRCRYCAEPISKGYLLLELGGIFLALVIYSIFGFSVVSLFLLCLMPFVLVQFLLFYRRNIISGQLCVIIGVLFLMYSMFEILN